MNSDMTTQENKRYIDYSLIFALLFLIVFGLIMVYSVTSYEDSLVRNDPTNSLRKQTIVTLVGLVGMCITTVISKQLIKKMAIVIYAVAFLMIPLVLTPLGIEGNSATRWIGIGDFAIQPAEVAKVAVIIAMASSVVKYKEKLDDKKVFWNMLCMPIPLCLETLLITKDMSSAIIIFLIGFAMVFVASPKTAWVSTLAFAGLMSMALVVFLVVKFPDFDLWSFRGNRIIAWTDPLGDTPEAQQTAQALYAIGTGGYTGLGIGESIQKRGSLPEAQNDMIFAVVCEELGLFGGICIIALYVIVIYRMFIIAINTKDLFSAYLVVGVMAHIAIQAILNIAVVSNVIPNTGITLPFISKGGSAIAILLAEIGLVFNTSKDIVSK